MKIYLLLLSVFVLSVHALFAKDESLQVETFLYLKAPGNPAEKILLTKTADNYLKASQKLPLIITQKVETKGDLTNIHVYLKAEETVYYNLEQIYKLQGVNHKDCQFYMPGFWYRKNLRSPADAPSFHTSDSWQVREDRLSTPLTGIFQETTGNYYTVLRMDELLDDTLTPHSFGETILTDRTSLGFTGFRNINGTSALVFGYPYHEAPNTYLRKLTLAPWVQTFDKLEKGETRELLWQVKTGNTQDFSTFVADIWNYSYDTLAPQTFEESYTNEEAKAALTNFFVESFVDKYDLKYYSGVHMRTDDCESTAMAEVGFIGRVLLNAFNALEYGETHNRPELVKSARAIFDSYLQHGFTPNGFFKEFVDFKTGYETDVYSIRRQSEGAFAILNYLNYERQKGRKHEQWDKKIEKLLANFSKLQNEDGSFPRKFDENMTIIDASGGSTPSATLPLTMAYKYFNGKDYLKAAQKTAIYLEKELIAYADYFSSTLDANCEDKEASLYASTAMYYLSMVTKGKERQHYIDLCKQAAYFSLSWYYLWDVPFAQGQMLGDVGFK